MTYFKAIYLGLADFGLVFLACALISVVTRAPLQTPQLAIATAVYALISCRRTKEKTSC